ncbi:MAG: C1 family peptidase, partial [Bacteroidota bacterium]
KSQGSTPSCIPWATAYAGLTIVKRIERGSLDVSPFSAMNLYNRVRPYDNLYNCSAGSMFSSNVALIKSKGCSYDYEYSDYCENLSYSKSYSNKLYDYIDLSISASNIKYSIAKNRPVMIGMKIYTGEYWGTMSYHSTGIWDGYHTGKFEWNHGMLIIGYDDYVGGGAFLVMNSWGKDFGKDGFFWLKYKNVPNEVICAYAMIPQVDRSDWILGGKTRGEAKTTIPDVDGLEIFSNGSGVDSVNNNQSNLLIFQNRCSRPIEIALGMKSDQGEKSKGWYALNSFTDVEVSINSNDEIYIYAQSKLDSWNLRSTKDAREFSVDTSASFSLSNSTNGVNLLFSPIKTNSKMLVLTCEGVHKPQLIMTSNTQLDSSDFYSRNMNWNGKDVLFDLTTNQVISPKANGEFEIFVTDGKSNPKSVRVTRKKLSKMNLFKFSTEENAKEFLKIQ